MLCLCHHNSKIFIVICYVCVPVDLSIYIFGYFFLQKLKDVQEFLRVPYRDLESRQVKIHTAPLSEQIQNWDEVQKALTGTPYQSFLRSN